MVRAGALQSKWTRSLGAYVDALHFPRQQPPEAATAIASAAAMSIVILLTSAGVRLAHWLLVRGLVRRTQAWRQR